MKLKVKDVCKMPELKEHEKDCWSHEKMPCDCDADIRNAIISEIGNLDTDMEYLDEKEPIHVCKCRNHKDVAITVRRIDEGISQCPRCGGIIVAKPVKEELDEKKVCEVVRKQIQEHLKTTFQSLQFELNLSYEISKAICAKFALPTKPEVPSERELEKLYQEKVQEWYASDASVKMSCGLFVARAIRKMIIEKGKI